MICNRHNAIAQTQDDLGHPLCSACFVEALRFADAVETERTIQRIRQRLKLGFR